MKSSLIKPAFFAGGIAFALAGWALAADPDEFVVYNYIDSANRIALPGRLYQPTDASRDPKQLRPLILFFCGSGETGTNNLDQVNGNIDNLLAAAKARGAFLYAPQTPGDWDETSVLTAAMTMIDRAITERGVDPARIYVTGVSLGGGGVWNFLNLSHDRVAAAVPICGSEPVPAFEPANLLHVPIWAFHGRSDEDVPVSVTRNTINALLKLSGRPPFDFAKCADLDGPNILFDDDTADIHYTDYRGVHGIWPDVYKTPALYDWLFAHHLRMAGAAN
jgi:predicted peptidase